MQEVFEKIKERLEEVRDERALVAEHTLDVFPDGQVSGLEKAIEIVNQVAEEYANMSESLTSSDKEVCKWIETIFFTFTDCGKRIDNSKLYYDEYVFCPYCGKEIKVVE